LLNGVERCFKPRHQISKQQIFATKIHIFIH
jgi:hypothetical protein